MSEVQKILTLLEQAVTPLIFFDDDPDGLCSALLIYRRYKKGQLIALTGTTDKLEHVVQKKIEEYNPDLVVFLDKAVLPEELLAQLPQTVWIDHHEKQEYPQNVVYYNPDNNNPTTQLVYDLLGKPQEDLWVAECGVVADWHVTNIHEQFVQHYPHLAKKNMTAPELLFSTQLGTLIRVLSFCLHGKSKDIRQSIKVLTRIAAPEEILDQSSPQGKWMWKQFQQANKEYEALRQDVETNAHNSDKHLIYKYTDAITSYTAYLSNHLLFEHPNKLIVIARNKNATYKCSLRITPPYVINEPLNMLSTQYPVEGGGHPQACGARIPEAIFDEVMQKLEDAIFEQ